MFYKTKNKIDKNKYKFTEDWFSHESESKVVIQFEKFLSQYKNKPCRFLEIGSFEGMSAIWMLENILTHKDSRLWCFDKGETWTKNSFETLITNIYKTNKQNQVEITKGSAEENLVNFPRNYFDFIYIDGDHEAETVLEDAILSFRILKLGGIIALDDYLLGMRWPKSPGAIACKNPPKKAIDYFLEIYAEKIKILYKDYQVWIKKIKE